MSPAPFSIGVVMIGLGVIPVATSLVDGQRAGDLGVVAWAWAALLIVGGVALLMRRRVAFWISLGAGAATAALGAWGLAREGAAAIVPLPPVGVLVAGLYICARVTMVRPALGDGGGPRVDTSPSVD